MLLLFRPMLDRGEGAGLYRPRKDDGDAFGDADEQMKQLTSTSRFKADRGFKVRALPFLMYSDMRGKCMLYFNEGRWQLV